MSASVDRSTFAVASSSARTRASCRRALQYQYRYDNCCCTIEDVVNIVISIELCRRDMVCVLAKGDDLAGTR